MRGQPVELVIADVNMPDMDGIELVNALRAHEEARIRTIPVVLITGDKSDDLRDRVKTMQVDAFLQKPLRAESLAALVDNLLASRR